MGGWFLRKVHSSLLYPRSANDWLFWLMCTFSYVQNHRCKMFGLQTSKWHSKAHSLLLTRKSFLLFYHPILQSISYKWFFFLPQRWLSFHSFWGKPSDKSAPRFITCWRILVVIVLIALFIAVYAFPIFVSFHPEYEDNPTKMAAITASYPTFIIILGLCFYRRDE